jgi:hypothetical protein
VYKILEFVAVTKDLGYNKESIVMIKGNKCNNEINFKRFVSVSLSLAGRVSAMPG